VSDAARRQKGKGKGRRKKYHGKKARVARISRREVLKTGVAAVTSGVLPRTGRRRPFQPARRRPHVLLLMADQFRADCVGADGNRSIQTPNLDRLAVEGVRFHSAYSSTPTCTPARAALLTGCSPWRHGMLGHGEVAERYPAELPRLFNDAGYHTAVVGKCHYHPQRNAHGFAFALLDESGRVEDAGFRSDYRSWFWSQAPGENPDRTGIGWNDYRSRPYALPERLHPTTWTGDCAVRFITDYARSEPFLLKVSFARPHSPYDPPERLMRRYADVSLPGPHVGDWAARYAPRSGAGNEIWHGELPAEQVRASRKGYYGAVTFVDEQVGRILEALERRAWLDDTLVIFTSDHGDMTGDHHLWRKSYGYESSARIPMLLRWPAGVPGVRGRVVDKPVELRDVLPTLLEAASIATPPGVDGSSVLAAARSPDAAWRPYVDLEHDVCYDAANHWNALTDGRWKYIFHAREGDEQLFDLARDAGELHDLASHDEHAGRLRGWRERLVTHLSERGERFVKAGRLVLRSDSLLYSPNYPR
jgi:arylsulfatase